MPIVFSLLVTIILPIISCSNECIVNYSLNCPEGWKPIGGSQCLAPISYIGPCDSIISVLKSSNDVKNMEAKKKIESKCKVNWPCSKIDNNYSKCCPDLWYLKPNGVCSPTYGYIGNCTDHHFSNTEDKIKWSHICNLKWSKNQDVDITVNNNEKKSKITDTNTVDTGCPKGWDRVMDMCISPKNYTGPCLSVAQIANKSQDFKKTYAFLCDVSF